MLHHVRESLHTQNTQISQVTGGKETCLALQENCASPLASPACSPWGLHRVLETCLSVPTRTGGTTPAQKHKPMWLSLHTAHTETVREHGSASVPSRSASSHWGPSLRSSSCTARTHPNTRSLAGTTQFSSLCTPGIWLPLTPKRPSTSSRLAPRWAPHRTGSPRGTRIRTRWFHPGLAQPSREDTLTETRESGLPASEPSSSVWPPLTPPPVDTAGTHPTRDSQVLGKSQPEFLWRSAQETSGVSGSG